MADRRREPRRCALALDDVGSSSATLLTAGLTRPLDQLATGQLRAWPQAGTTAGRPPPTRTCWSTGAPQAGTGPVSRGYIQDAVRKLGITPQNLRRQVPLRSPGHRRGPLQLSHLFGISDPSAIRSCAELGLIDGDSPAGR